MPNTIHFIQIRKCFSVFFRNLDCLIHFTLKFLRKYRACHQRDHSFYHTHNRTQNHLDYVSILAHQPNHDTFLMNQKPLNFEYHLLSHWHWDNKTQYIHRLLEKRRLSKPELLQPQCLVCFSYVDYIAVPKILLYADLKYYYIDASRARSPSTIWRRRTDSNRRGLLDPASLAVRCFRPLSHVSKKPKTNILRTLFLILA